MENRFIYALKTNMILSLIGMSGVGKTTLAKKLEKEGFIRFSCDTLVEERLKLMYPRRKFGGTRGMAKWMGHPYHKQYDQSSKEYIELEKDVMQLLLNQTKNMEKANVVFDTTGSVIYTGSKILQQLCRKTNVIYLSSPPSVLKEMYKTFLADPKPIYWGNAFKKRADETNQEAIARCYTDLLAYRAKQYEKIAHKTIDYHVLRHKTFSVDYFLDYISKPL